MRWKIVFAGLSFVAAAALASLATVSAADRKAMTDKPLGKYFNFAGLNLRVDKIETLAQPDSRAVIAKAGSTPPGTGYILVTFSAQDPRAGDQVRDILENGGGTSIGFELADGTQIDEFTPGGIFLMPALTDPPDYLHPKQTIHIVYVVPGWNKSPITKMFLHCTADYNSAGALYARFQIRPGFVVELQPQ